MSSNSRSFLDSSGDRDHAMVAPITEVRDSLGTLAVQILASKCDLSSTPYDQIIQALYDTVVALHAAYDNVRTHIQD